MQGIWPEIVVIALTIARVGFVLGCVLKQRGKASDRAAVDRAAQEIMQIKKIIADTQFHIDWMKHSGERQKAAELQEYMEDLQATLQHLERV